MLGLARQTSVPPTATCSKHTSHTERATTLPLVGSDQVRGMGHTGTWGAPEEVREQAGTPGNIPRGKKDQAGAQWGRDQAERPAWPRSGHPAGWQGEGRVLQPGPQRVEPRAFECDREVRGSPGLEG